MYDACRRLLCTVSLAAGSLAWTSGAPINGGPELKLEVVSERIIDIPWAEYQVIKRAPNQSVYLFSPESKLLVRISQAGDQPETIDLTKILPIPESRLRNLLPALAFDSNGNAFIAAELTSREAPAYGVYVISGKGAFVKKVELDPAGRLQEFAIDSKGRIVVVGPGIGWPVRECIQIHQYEADGRYLKSLPPCRQPEGQARMWPLMGYSGGRSIPLWIENDRIHYIPPKDDRLLVFGADGTPAETRYLVSPPVEADLRKRGFLATPEIPAEVLAAWPAGEERLLLAWRRSGIMYVALHRSQGAPLSAALPASQIDGWPLACDSNGECEIVWQGGSRKLFIRRVRISFR